MDFSENYSSKSQDDLQQTYFGKNQISLFTVVAYVGTRMKKISIVIANDNCSHSKEQVFYYMRLIVDELKKERQDLKKIFFVSDDAGSQFNYRFILTNMMQAKSDLGVNVQWDFFPTSHGKSPADGLGGTVKRGVCARVLSGSHLVYNAKEFVECAKSFCKTSTRLICVTDDDMRETFKMLKIRWANTKALIGTRSYHHFKPAENGKDLLAAVSSIQDDPKTFKNRV